MGTLVGLDSVELCGSWHYTDIYKLSNLQTIARIQTDLCNRLSHKILSHFNY